jgi:hypothetical protein
MKRLWFLLLFGLTACASAVPSPEPNSPVMNSSSLPNLGRAPEFVNEVWLNTDQPLRLADLRGKVVLVDMWTFG